MSGSKSKTVLTIQQQLNAEMVDLKIDFRAIRKDIKEIYRIG